eukprot:gnl/TRDRNA2_/TRDRNA2_166268_c0_seq1.p1 gnl/TRDRNA2_/TRDRNA2_166268_c0~~gnl/TRDRNA2_/TRDRNA2_166268_c0_seq1.p1  ORF type:complete len:672 (-),score=124.39 gnl/TRDRNA2_/TRDRNA2_166268_c0_seq1:87-1823(-)
MGLGKTVTILALILSDVKPSVERDGGKVGRNLVVCPLSVIQNWVEQIRVHAPSLRVRTYHGPDRDREPSSFVRHDVTLTTYDVVRSEAKDRGRGLGSVSWHRAVLDEAHVIKSHRTATAQAVFDLLKAERRWCLTGTPIQNAIEDVYSLARFLKLEPFDRLDWFNRTIVRPLKSRDIVGFERLQVLLRTWCLRRTKDMKITDTTTGSLRPLLMLPQKTVELVRVPLDSGDRKLYDTLFECARNRVMHLEKTSSLGENFTQVLSLLTRLRQLCCSTSLLPEKLLAELRAGGDNGERRALELANAALGSQRVEELIRGLEESQDDDCSICLLPACDAVTRCGHQFHRACMEVAVSELGSGGSGPCPLCRRPVRLNELLKRVPAETPEADGAPARGGAAAGSKVRAVVDFLMEQIVGKIDPYLGKPRKAVVFSQFTSLLTVCQTELQGRRAPFARLDGSMAHSQRVEALQNFGDHGHVQVILCSLKAAGVGINLTAADHVLLIDPWWNPMVEDQAIDRVYRLGQRRPVRAMRFVAEETVEERILEVHEQKRAVVEGALTRKSREELQRMRFELVASIFRPH